MAKIPLRSNVTVYRDGSRFWWEEVTSERRRAPLFTGNIPALFEMPAKELAAQFVALADSGDTTATRWLEMLLNDREATLAELIKAKGLDLTLFVVRSGNGIDWGKTYPSEKSLEKHRDALYAWALVRITRAKLDRRIRRCQQKDCRKIFFGDVRAKWCSENCGSKHRVREKRRLDRQR